MSRSLFDVQQERSELLTKTKRMTAEYDELKTRQDDGDQSDGLATRIANIRAGLENSVLKAAKLTEEERELVLTGVKNGTLATEAGAHGVDDKPHVDTKTAPTLPEWATKHRRTDQADWAEATAQQLQKATTVDGRKSIVAGAFEVLSPIRSDISRIPSYPQRVLDLLVNRVQLNTGNVFWWLQQSVRAHNAQSVPDTLIKPESTYTFEELEDRVRTIAHLSEDLPNRFLSDFRGLQEFLQAEMAQGLSLEVERQVLSGNGTPGASSQGAVPGEDMRGLLNTPGILVQAWSTNLLTTLRKAATKLELAGQTPTAWAIHPSDVETLDLLQDGMARMYFQGPNQQLAEQSPVWSNPIVRSVSVPAGTAILGTGHKSRWSCARTPSSRSTPSANSASSGTCSRHVWKAATACT